MPASDGGVFGADGGFGADDGLFGGAGAPSGVFSGGGGFDVEPEAIRGGAGPLGSAGHGSRAHGHSLAMEASTAACAAGGDPLAGALRHYGGQVEVAGGQFGEALAASATALEATAAAYARSDAPFPVP